MAAELEPLGRLLALRRLGLSLRAVAERLAVEGWPCDDGTPWTPWKVRRARGEPLRLNVTWRRCAPASAEPLQRADVLYGRCPGEVTVSDVKAAVLRYPQDEQAQKATRRAGM